MPEESSTDTCSYVFNPDEWKKDNDGEPSIDQVWECPHPCYSDDRCVFHLDSTSPENVEPEEIQYEFISAIHQEGRHTKEFVGASFPDLNLAHKTVESPDQFPIKTIHSQINTLNLSNTEINQSLTIDNSEILEATANNAKFRSKSDFSVLNTVFERTADFSDCQFGRAYFNHSTFNGEAVFNDSVFEEAHFFGSVFQSDIDFSWGVCSGRFHISRSTIEGDVNLRNCHLKKDSRFIKSEFNGKVSFNRIQFRSATFSDASFNESVSFSHADFDEIANFTPNEKTRLSEAEFRGVDFEDGVIFHSVDFDHSTDFRDAEFGGSAIFNNSTFDGEVDFSQTQFHDQVEMANVTFLGEFNCISADVEQTGIFEQSIFYYRASFESSNFDTLYFDSTKFHVGPKFDRSDIGTIRFQLEPVDDKILISMVHTEMETGEIHHPEEHYALFDLTRATLGNLELYEDFDGNIFDPFQFNETTFDGFDFNRYRRELEDLDWSLDSAVVDEEKLEDRVQSTEELLEETGKSASIGEFSMVDRQEGTHPDISRPNEYLETTYLKAKNGAKQVGDSKSTSEFFLKEMKHRRYRHKSEVYSAFPLLSVIENPRLLYELDKLRHYPHRPLDAVRSVSRWIINSVLGVSSGYGERLRYVIGWSFAIILFGMLFYPSAWFGGLEENDPEGSIVYMYDRTISENLLSPSYYPQLVESLFDIWQNSFYYSAVTFTTIGSNSYQIDSSVAKLFFAFESFSGAFLIALFVYSLGKQVAR